MGADILWIHAFLHYTSFRYALFDLANLCVNLRCTHSRICPRRLPPHYQPFLNFLMYIADLVEPQFSNLPCISGQRGT